MGVGLGGVGIDWGLRIFTGARVGDGVVDGAPNLAGVFGGTPFNQALDFRSGRLEPGKVKVYHFFSPEVEIP